MFRFTHHTRKDVCEVPGGVVAYRSCVIDNRPERRAQLVDLGVQYIRGTTSEVGYIHILIHIRKEQDKPMNRDEGSYQLSHIYDNLFVPNLSGERRLDRPFRRRLQSKLKRQH